MDTNRDARIQNARCFLNYGARYGDRIVRDFEKSARPIRNRNSASLQNEQLRHASFSSCAFHAWPRLTREKRRKGRISSFFSLTQKIKENRTEYE